MCWGQQFSCLLFLSVTSFSLFHYSSPPECVLSVRVWKRLLLSWSHVLKTNMFVWESDSVQYSINSLALAPWTWRLRSSPSVGTTRKKNPSLSSLSDIFSWKNLRCCWSKEKHITLPFHSDFVQVWHNQSVNLSNVHGGHLSRSARVESCFSWCCEVNI